MLHTIDCRTGSIIADFKVCVGSVGLIKSICALPEGNTIEIQMEDMFGLAKDLNSVLTQIEKLSADMANWFVFIVRFRFKYYYKYFKGKAEEKQCFIFWIFHQSILFASI